jgi:CBS domain-containing protein
MTNVWLPPIDAGDVMTKNVVSVDPETPARTVAKLLLEKRISAVPVVDVRGQVIGMVSEGDLIGRGIAGRAPGRLEILAEGEDLAAEFLDYVKTADRPVREMMKSPVVTVSENTPVQTIAEVLEQHHIKRVPVLRDGRMVGIVSRADLVRALSQFPGRPG